MNERKLSWLLGLLLIITGATAWLSGCGQKGPLYLPNELHQEHD
ncbi:MAG: lipoprotein [Halobacteria archaeon]|nr:lipoprotein [Halobacteria archaeon]